MAKKQSLTPEELAAQELSAQELANATAKAERQDSALKFASAKRLASAALDEMTDIDNPATARFLMPTVIEAIQYEIDSDDPAQQELFDSFKKTWEAIAQHMASDQDLDLDQYLKFDRSLVRSRDKF